MLLAIDVGNTNTVFAIHDGVRFLAQWRCETNGKRTSDEHFVWLDALMRAGEIDQKMISAVVIASVEPRTLFNLRRLCGSYFDCRPLVVGDPNCALGVEAHVECPAEVGADRLVNALAAYESYGPNLIIIDFGTATTFDVVDEDGSYVGGVIAPGVNLSVEALYQAAAKLPRISIARPAQVVGKATTTAMQSGVYWGYVSLIEGISRRIAIEMDRKMTVIGTGGLSAMFSKGTDIFDQVDPDLTLRGLVQIHRRNAGQTMP